MENVTKPTLRPSPDAMLNPRLDANFKTLFTDNSDEARLALKSFLEAFMNTKITHVELRPNETSIEAMTDKMSRFDVACTLDNGEAVNVEMQGENDYAAYDKRAEYYVAHLLNHYTPSGENWTEVPKVFQISVLNFIYDITSKDTYSVYKMQTNDNRHLSDRLNVIFIELPKINDVPDDIERLTLSEKWSKFLLYADKKDKRDFVKKLCESEEGIMAAQSTLAKISEDEANWLRETARDMWERDLKTRFYTVKHNALLETARNLLNMGLTLEQITQATGLPLSEVTALQAELSDVKY